MNDIFEEVLATRQKGEGGALATVIARKGSAPMAGDAKMLVRKDGSISGTIGGGCLEAEVWQAAIQVMKEDEPTTLSFTLTEKEAGESGLICGGVVDIFVEPISRWSEEILRSIIKLRSEGGRAALASVIETYGGGPLRSEKVLILREGGSLGTISGIEDSLLEQAAGVMKGEQPLLTTLEPEGKPLKVFIEPVLVRPTAFIFGGGHISLALCSIATLAGFRVVVVEDRPQFASKERFPEADSCILGDFPEVFSQLRVDDSSYLILVTRGHQHDITVLEWAMGTDARYIGMIGSKSKVLVAFRRLSEKGIPGKALEDRVYAPIGLDIGSETPGEIAVSIVAQMVQVRRGRERTAKGVPVIGKQESPLRGGA